MSSVWRDVHKAIKKHARILRPITPKVLKSHPWPAGASGELKRREYRTYAAYVAHQRRKLARMKKSVLEEYDATYRAALRARLEEHGTVRRGASVLCLAARLGTEVKAFLDLGCFAVGLDLNPGADNKYVVVGDFHDLQFAAGSVDVVFTNSLDHAFELERIVVEVKRVLKPGGRFVLEINPGEQEGFRPLYYEATVWNTVDDVLKILGRHGFTVVTRAGFDYPWRGEHITLVAGG